jgi:hypothetical protein
MAGAADSFNMLVPHSGCDPSHDLNAEYKQIRGTAALDNTELLEIENDLDGTSKAQPCSKFGMHHKMTAVHGAYNAGDAAWIANMGSLVEPVTKQEYKDKAKALPPSLFAHNVMQRSIATMHPQLSSASGILGRMSESIEQGVNPYRSALYSMAGVRSLFFCGICGVCGVCGVGGVCGVWGVCGVCGVCDVVFIPFFRSLLCVLSLFSFNFFFSHIFFSFSHDLFLLSSPLRNLKTFE